MAASYQPTDQMNDGDDFIATKREPELRLRLCHAGPDKGVTN